MEVKQYIPHPALRDYVFSIATVNVALPAGMDVAVNPYPPTPFQSLMFYCNHPVCMSKSDEQQFQRQATTVLVGPQYSRVNIKVIKQLTAIRVDFLPGGMHRMLGVPMHELFDIGCDAEDFFGTEMKQLNEQLKNINTLEKGKAIVEQFLLNKLRTLKMMLPFDTALRTLMNNDGAMSIEKTASLACLSLKQFERKCKERIGMNPKLYARILKFSKAYRLHEAFPQHHWIQIAYEAGYYDQMHMIKDFKIFAGVNPSVIEQELLFTPLRMQKNLRF